MNNSSTTAFSEATCTICGLKYEDRVAFNAHIRAHLKDKLTSRREQKLAAAAASSPPAPQSPKRSKVSNTANREAKAAKLTNIQSLLPSSPLPLIKANNVNRDRPNLEYLLNQLQTSSKLASNHPLVMAELAACKPIPPQSCLPTAATRSETSVTVKQLITLPNSSSSTLPTTWSGGPTTTSLTPASQITEPMPCTPDISDMEEDLMSYEMEMNRIDFHNDLASILDQIEKDFESPCLSHDLRLDTPPDSDSENSDHLNKLLNNVVVGGQNSHQNYDLLGFDQFSQRINLNVDQSEVTAASGRPTLLKLEADNTHVRLVQSPASVARVGRLPAKALAVLNKLPAKLFVASSPQLSIPTQTATSSSIQSRFVDVVKVERSSLQAQFAMGAGNTQCIINIECRQPGKGADEPAKIIQTFRAIDTGSEIKLVPADMPMTTIIEPTAAISSSKSKSTSHCPVCSKCITNKNMARHMEKHYDMNGSSMSTTNIVKKIPPDELKNSSVERRYLCKYCCKAFSQRSHLNRHVKAHTSSKGDLLTCRVCGKVCKNRVSLVRHRAKHLSCVHCSALFNNKVALHDHLLKAHPEKAIVSLVQPPVQDNRLDLDDLGSIGSNASHSIDYSFSPDDTVGESLADIADTNYFNCNSATEITDEFYSTDLFATSQTC